MKYRTVTIYQCDKCGCDLPNDMLECYRLSQFVEEESHHNGDTERGWNTEGNLCKKCGETVYKFIKG